MNLTGRRNELSDYPNVKAAAFASAIVADGYNGHTQKVLLSSVGNKLAVVVETNRANKSGGYYYTDIDAQGLDQAELLWLLQNPPHCKRRYKQVKPL